MMLRIAFFIAVGIAVIHGLIHLMGFVAYWPLAEIAELPYKTTLLNGRFQLGQSGMRLFSVLWLLTAVGLVGAGVEAGLMQGADHHLELADGGEPAFGGIRRLRSKK